MIITALRLIGNGVPDATADFHCGLNVVSGPSDTGKTFIFQCINYMLGGSLIPTQIPESEKYESIMLSLRMDNGTEAVLKRSIKGGAFTLQLPGSPTLVLKEKHAPMKCDTISHFLLNGVGLSGKYIRTNAQGKNRELSFRDLSDFILVDEEVVISKISPIFSGQYTSKTAETSAFRLLLSGNDDSSIISLKEDIKIEKGRKEGIEEIVNELQAKNAAQILSLNLDGDEVEIKRQFERIGITFNELSIAISNDQFSVTTTAETRNLALESLRKIESRINVLSELQKRFGLLSNQYQSDLRRLNAISEAGFRLGQMNEKCCPVCGALAEHQDLENLCISTEDIVASCNAESSKIISLYADLQLTMNENNQAMLLHNTEKEQKRQIFEKANHELNDCLLPKLQLALQSFRDLQEKRDLYQLAIALYKQNAELSLRLNGINNTKSTTQTKSSFSETATSEIELLCKDCENILRSWKFPNLTRVTFSENKQDLIISGRMRDSHGKGVRAVIHAAFNLAILRYCLSNSKPHPGFVVIDSPLVVYRQPDTDEEDIAQSNLKDEFYRSIANDFKDSQVIILENEDPPADILSNANVIKFTKSKQGRYGFIPC